MKNFNQNKRKSGNIPVLLGKHLLPTIHHSVGKRTASSSIVPLILYIGVWSDRC